MRINPTRLFACLSLFLLATALRLATPAAAQTPAWQWGLQTLNPTPADGTPADGNAVATDAAGRVYVGGSFGDDASNAVQASRSFGSAGSVGPGAGGFVAQASATGQWTWVTPVQTIGSGSSGASTAAVSSVVVTATGDVYATGFAHGRSLLVGSSIYALGTSGTALFVARLNSAGICQWVQVVECPTAWPILAADPSTGGVVLAGTYQGSPSFGSTTLPAGSSNSAGAPFVARLSPTGQWLAALTPTGTATFLSTLGLAVGPAGQVALVGTQRPGTLSFGATTLTVASPQSEAFFVAQLSPANQWQWAVGGSGSTRNSLAGAAYTPNGALWVGGTGTPGTVIGPLTLSAGTAAASSGFLGQLSSAGQWTAGQQCPSLSDGYVALLGIAINASGQPLVVGGLRAFATAAQVGVGSQVLTAPAEDLLYFVTGLTAAGEWGRAQALPQASIRQGLRPAGIALDAAGSLYLTGNLRGTLSLGSSTLTGTTKADPNITSTGDAILIKLANATALPNRTAAATTALTLCPNPAYGTATLTLPATSAARTIVLLDVLGRLVRQQPLPAQAATTHLDLSGLPAGLYVVRCGSGTARLRVE
jgi:hypothetical protein